jgi:OOP family OmpA-OmpF porin
MNIFKILPCLATTLLIGACSDIGPSFVVDGHQDTANALRPVDDPFQQALVQGYRKNADDEYVQGNYRSADRYYLKAIAASDGQAVVMEEPSSWTVATGVRDKGLYGADLQKAVDTRANLAPWIAATKQSDAQAAAAQQLKYDCWIEQMAEQQYDQAAICSPTMQVAAVPPKPVAQVPQPAPEPFVPARYTVYFDFDRATLTPQSQEVIKTAIAASTKMGATEISVTGHADRAGSEDYNIDLSLRRANTVRDMASLLGADINKIGVGGRGEADPAVATQDGVRMPSNRRAEIIVGQ